VTFLHVSLLAGAAFVAVPIVLHLIMRQRPRRLEFPALRFIERRHDANRRRLQLRHLLLLLLRAGVLALLAFALARPSIKFGGIFFGKEAPVSAALVFDTAPRMEYRHENKTRLQAAQEFGGWLLSQLPAESEIAVLDTRPAAAAAFLPDRRAAAERIERLSVAADARSLPDVLQSAVELLDRGKSPRKELYVFTDLCRGGWPERLLEKLRSRLAALKDAGLYLIDVGIAEPTNYGLEQLRLSGEVLPNGATLTVESALSCYGSPATRIVSLYLLDENDSPSKRSSESLAASSGELRPVEFRISGLEPGVHQGFIRIGDVSETQSDAAQIVGQDGLAADDVRYFTVEVKSAWRILLSAPQPVENYALFLGQALSPDVFRRRGQARFECETCELEKLPERDLSAFSAVCLLDPTPLEPAVWSRLKDYVSEGYGLGIFLGRNALPLEAFNNPTAQEVLAGKLLRQVRRPEGDVWFAPQSLQHPVLQAFRGYSETVPWQAFPVFRYWQLESVPGGTNVLVPYNDGRPALLERPLGRGRILMMTTPVSDRPNRNPWNLLPVGEAWPFVVLMNQMAVYLVGSAEVKLNYLAGDTAVLPLDASQRRQSYILSLPDGLKLPLAADLTRRELIITATEQVGNYQLQAGGEKGVKLGFSVNYAPEQTQLDRLSDEESAELLKSLNFRLARSREQIDRQMNLARVGHELFPGLILLVALLLGLELLVAERFYGR